MKKNYSAQRNLILSVLRSTKVHPSAETLCEMCKSINPKIGLATIYRNLADFEKEGLLIKVSGAVGKERYDGDTSIHNHIICPKCGKIDDAMCADDLKTILEQEIIDNTYDGAQVTFYKICDECKNKISEE